MIPEKRLNVADVAQIYGVTSRTVLAWVRDGILPCIRLRTIIRFRTEDLEAMESWHAQNSNGQITDSDKTPEGYGSVTGPRTVAPDVSALELRTRWKPGGEEINSSLPEISQE